MSDRIDLDALRKRPFRRKPWVNVRRSELDALVTAAEAACEFVATTSCFRQSSDSRSEFITLSAAVARFGAHT